MTGGHDPGADGGPDQRALQSGRAWQHPSEVGLATRGRADRRRSTVIAGGVVLGGVGLLLSGVLMGTMQQPASATTSTVPAERANQSITLVTADGGGAAATGLILDDEGHVLVDARTLAGSDVWVRCADGEMEKASVMARDERTDLAVLQLDRPHGVPASFASGTPDPGDELQLVSAGQVVDTSVSLSARATSTARVGQLIDLTVTPAPRQFLATVSDDPAPSAAALTGGMVFDRSGRLAGVVTDVPSDTNATTVRVLSADDAVGVAEDLLGQQR